MIMVPKRIVIIGSSSAEGKVDPKYGGFAGRLRVWHESIDQHNHVFNLAISGDTTSDMLNRLVPESAPRRPQLIILQHGLNDIIREGSKIAQVANPIFKFKENITSLITQGQSLGDVIMLSVYPINDSLTTPVSWKSIFYLFEDAKIYATAAKNICKNLHIPYVDIFNQWLQIDYKKYLHTDGLHANSLGHKKIFAELVKELKRIYE